MPKLPDGFTWLTPTGEGALRFLHGETRRVGAVSHLYVKCGGNLQNEVNRACHRVLAEWRREQAA